MIMLFGGRNFETTTTASGDFHIYPHGGAPTMSSNQHTNNSSSQILRDSYNTSGNAYSSDSSQHQLQNSSQDDSSRGSISQRRRSHRPRGCRGGRKNRKNREAKAARSVPTAGSNLMVYSAQQPPHNKPISEAAAVKEGDLSRYQHVNTTSRNTTSTSNNAWAQRSPSILPPPSSSGSCSTTEATTLQMLPPPLPPFVNGSDPFVAKEAKDISKYLKMLPSFEEPEHSFSSSSQDDTLVSSNSMEHNKLWGEERIMCGAISTSSSNSSSGDEAGSLFVTSPRSFLMGNLVQVEGFPRSRFSLW